LILIPTPPAVNGRGRKNIPGNFPNLFYDLQTMLFVGLFDFFPRIFSIALLVFGLFFNRGAGKRTGLIHPVHGIGNTETLFHAYMTGRASGAVGLSARHAQGMNQKLNTLLLRQGYEKHGNSPI
jgi:hypothetical protein